MLAINGGTGRIRVFDVPGYNYADIKMDQRAGMSFDMLKIASLSEVKSGGGSVNPAPASAVLSADPEVWFSLQGKSVLESCISDLRAHGHSKLGIKENGDVFVMREGKEIVGQRLKNFPDKSVWPKLIKVFEKAGLSAAVAGDVVALTW